MVPARLNRVRQYRKSQRLAQRELAGLVGMLSQRSFSEMETGRKRPGLVTALACALVLDVTVGELFPWLERAIEGAVLARAEHLFQQLKSDAHREAAADHVADLIRRLTHADV